MEIWSRQCEGKQILPAERLEPCFGNKHAKLDCCYNEAVWQSLCKQKKSWIVVVKLVNYVTNRGTNVTGDKRYHGIYQAEV